MAVSDDGFDFEATEEALAKERDEIDAAASEAPYRPSADDLPEAHTEDRENLGFDLAWWAEEDGMPNIDIAVNVANNACGIVGYVHDLQRHGYPEDAMQGDVTLDSISGPLVSAGLQILGTLHPHLRNDIEQTLKAIHKGLPEPTEAEQEAFETAASAIQQEQFASAGIPVVSLEDFLGGRGDPTEQDAGLN